MPLRRDPAPSRLAYRLNRMMLRPLIRRLVRIGLPAFMAALVVGRIPWNRWVRFYAPLLGVWVLISIGFLIFAQVTGWS